MLVQFHGLQFDLPAGWADITEELPVSSLPTLGRPDGVGVMQFSIARYSGGENPKIDRTGLENLLAQFLSRHALSGGELESIEGRVVIVGRIVVDEPTAVWYASNGRDVVLVTYTSAKPATSATSDELEQARKLVASLNF